MQWTGASITYLKDQIICLNDDKRLWFFGSVTLNNFFAYFSLSTWKDHKIVSWSQSWMEPKHLGTSNLFRVEFAVDGFVINPRNEDWWKSKVYQKKTILGQWVKCPLSPLRLNFETSAHFQIIITCY